MCLLTCWCWLAQPNNWLPLKAHPPVATARARPCAATRGILYFQASSFGNRWPFYSLRSRLTVIYVAVVLHVCFRVRQGLESGSGTAWFKSCRRRWHCNLGSEWRISVFLANSGGGWKPPTRPHLSSVPRAVLHIPKAFLRPVLRPPTSVLAH
jgi:hypothetical protein